MPLIGAGYFLENLEVNRILWLRGRQGGGKTSIAFLFAHHMLEHGIVKHVSSNIPNIWNTRARDLKMSKDDTLDVCFIADEGGRILRSRYDAEQYIFAMRKLNVFILIPSFLRPSSRVCFLDCQFIFSLTGIGLPLKVYKWRLSDGGQVESGQFIWWGYSEIWGIYSSKAVPLSDGGIRKAINTNLQTLAERDREWWEDGSSTGSIDGGRQLDGRSDNPISEMEEVESEFTDNLERQVNNLEGVLSVYSGKGRKKRRF